MLVFLLLAGVRSPRWRDLTVIPAASFACSARQAFPGYRKGGNRNGFHACPMAPGNLLTRQLQKCF